MSTNMAINTSNIGVFSKIPLLGKDVSLDKSAMESRDRIIDIQMKMETVLLNGDVEKAKKNIQRGMYYIKIKIS